LPTSEILLEPPVEPKHRTLNREVATSLQALSNFDGSETVSQPKEGATATGGVSSFIRKTSTNRFFNSLKKQQKTTIGGIQGENLEKAAQVAGETSNSYLVLEQFSEEIQNQLIDLAMSKRKAWSPRRFKKFPRFTIFLNRRGEEDAGVKEYLRDHIISLNPEFMNLLLNTSSADASGTETVIQ
jgi:hypothetical protein